MKKIYSILLALFVLGGGIAFAYDSDGNVHKEEGSGASIADAVRVYQLVRYPSVEAGGVRNFLSSGDVVVWDTNSDDGVTVNLTSMVGQSRDAVAGIVVSSTITGDTASGTAVQDIGHKNWGYIQTYGLCSVAKITGVVAFAGQPIGADATNPGYAVAIDSATATVRTVPLGFAYDSQATITTSGGKVFIKNR